ncbi:hypothetical protein KY360_05315 [Candidatus Woesearchaeota archaeon]|nr:hypothetical protein [Candidatus Woesearchaeota archaeon]
MKKEMFIVLIVSFSLLIPLIFAEVETPIGQFVVGNDPPPTPYAWTPTTTHDKNQNFSWTQDPDGNGDPIQTYVCVTNDTDTDDCSVVDTLNSNDVFWYAFDQSEQNWDYAWGSASRNYYVKLTPYDGNGNGTANDTISFTLTDAIPTISGQTSDASNDGDKDVGETISFSMTSHSDTDATDNHSVRVCQTDSINTSGECPGGEYCNEYGGIYSDDASLGCNYVAQQSDGTSNTAYFFVCDCPPNDNDCPGQCSSSYSHTFYVNHAPSASSVDITPNNPTSAQTLTCGYSFSDATDGDSEGTSTFKWYNWSGSVWIETAYTASTLADSNIHKGETWMCEVTPVDEHSFAGAPVNSTNETIGNTAPDQPTTFRAQDGAASYDNTDPWDTHDVTPYIDWSTSDNDGDTVTTYVCIATSAANRDAENCDASYTETVTDSVASVSGLAYSGTSRVYHIRLTPGDGTENGTALDTNITLINNIPSAPSGLSPISTHDQTPTLSWTATDADDGSVDGWPADSLTYYIRVGTSYGDGSYENNNNANKDGEVVDSAIPWGAPGEVWANNTVYVMTWTSDGNGPNSTSYNTTFVLYDYLPNITNVEMTDAGSSYSSCTSASCALNPIEHSNASVAARVTTIDTDNDCDVAGSNTYLYLCLDTGSCSPSTGDYSWEVDSVSRSGSTCTYIFTSNKTAADNTPEFFRLPDSGYKLYVNATSQGGQRTTDAERTADWTYGTVKAVDYPSLVTLGDGTPTLGQWNDGTSLATMTNWGNDILNLVWNATDPISGSDDWPLNGTDFQIDDDNSYSSEAGGEIAPVFLNGTQRTFEPASGLQVCSAYDCNDAALNETLSTYYHIFPPLGLTAGTYNTTILITIS